TVRALRTAGGGSGCAPSVHGCTRPCREPCGNQSTSHSLHRMALTVAGALRHSHPQRRAHARVRTPHRGLVINRDQESWPHLSTEAHTLHSAKHGHPSSPEAKPPATNPSASCPLDTSHQVAAGTYPTTPQAHDSSAPHTHAATQARVPSEVI